MSSSITLSLWEAVAGIATAASVGGGVSLWFVRSSLRDWRTARQQVLNWIDSGLSPEPEPAERPKLRLRKPGNPRERFTPLASTPIPAEMSITDELPEGWGVSNPGIAAKMLPGEPVVIETYEGRPTHVMQRCKVEPVTDYPGRKDDDDPTPPPIVDVPAEPEPTTPPQQAELLAALRIIGDIRVRQQAEQRQQRPGRRRHAALGIARRATQHRPRHGETPRHSFDRIVSKIELNHPVTA